MGNRYWRVSEFCENFNPELPSFTEIIRTFFVQKNEETVIRLQTLWMLNCVEELINQQNAQINF